MIRRLLCTLLCILTLSTATTIRAEDTASVICVDADTGRVVYERNADERRLIASTTKLMTALAVLETLQSDAVVTVSRKAAHTEGSSMYLKPGAEVTVRTLLYGLLLESGNDAAAALWEYDPTLVDRMNACADTLGMTDTHFMNPHGLDAEEHYSTARDLAKLAVYAMKNAALREITSTREYRAEGYLLHNHNKLLWRVEGCEGCKTGFTKKAGRCLISSACRDGRRVVVVTLGAADDWNVHEKLYTDAYAGTEVRTYLTEGQAVRDVRVQSGAWSRVTVRAAGGLCYRLTEDEAARAVYTEYLPHFIYAPVEAGSRAGYAVLTLDGRELCRSALLYETDVGVRRPAAGWWERLVRWLYRCFG